MNYRPYSGYWVVGASSKSERAAFFSSWGLLAIVPIGARQYPMRFFKALADSNCIFGATKETSFKAFKKMEFKAKQ
jgi:hypothetical protein